MSTPNIAQTICQAVGVPGTDLNNCAKILQQVAGSEISSCDCLYADHLVDCYVEKVSEALDRKAPFLKTGFVTPLTRWGFINRSAEPAKHWELPLIDEKRWPFGPPYSNLQPRDGGAFHYTFRFTPTLYPPADAERQEKQPLQQK